MSDNCILLRMEKVSKRYPGTLAVDNIDFEVKRGEVHALIGENGAGKSTLMNIIAGSFDDYTGKIFINDKNVNLHSPLQSKKHGIAMIYQELSLALPLSVAENVLVGSMPLKAGVLVDKKAMVTATRQCLEQVGLNVDPFMAVELLSQHEQQLVEIAKALYQKPSIMVMDEPTSALGSSEVLRLFEIIAQLKSCGITIIYISHHLPEVMRVADRVTIMRDGGKVDTLNIKETTVDTLIEMMVGRPKVQMQIERKLEPGRTRFRVRNFTRRGFFHDINFHICAGEIVGIGGLAGSGRSELARSICGLEPHDGGQIRLDKKRIVPSDMRTCIKGGIVYLTEDRKLQGLALKLNAQMNMLSALNAKSSRLMSAGEGRKLFDFQAACLQLYPADPKKTVSQLSGGNQQKILLGKWLATSPEVCILDEPTRGVDIGAKQVIHEAIAQMADRGKCVLLISSDLPELVMLSNRVMIMRKGYFIKEMTKQELSENAVLLAANGEMLSEKEGGSYDR